MGNSDDQHSIRLDSVYNAEGKPLDRASTMAAIDGRISFRVFTHDPKGLFDRSFEPLCGQ